MYLTLYKNNKIIPVLKYYEQFFSHVKSWFKKQLFFWLIIWRWLFETEIDFIIFMQFQAKLL